MMISGHTIKNFILACVYIIDIHPVHNISQTKGKVHKLKFALIPFESKTDLERTLSAYLLPSGFLYVI